MGEVVRFQRKQEKVEAECIAFQCSLTFHVQTDILDDNSVWYRVGTQNSWDKEIIWNEWRKVDE